MAKAASVADNELPKRAVPALGFSTKIGQEPSFANEGRTDDQHDAFSIAVRLSRARRDASLAAFMKPDLTPPEHAVAQVEGWTLGVPGLIRADGGRDGLATRR